MNREQRRAYWRNWARQKRHHQWLKVNEGQTTCQWRTGKYTCGGRLSREGGTLVCLWCVLKHAKLCRDCLIPIDDHGHNALRCRDCKHDELNAAERRYNARYPGRKNKEARDRLARWKAENDPRYHAKQAYKRAYRAANPDRVRTWKQTERRSERYKNYHKAYREKWAKLRAGDERLRQRAVRAGLRVTHPCQGCGAPLTGRAKKCRSCKIGKFVVALEYLGNRVSNVNAPIIGPWPSYADFRRMYA